MSYPFSIRSYDGSAFGKTAWRCPSNIAIVKYWGKHGVQLPRNASLSFTLDNAHTDTTMSYETHDRDGLDISFLFEGMPNQAFEDKLNRFLNQITEYFPFLSKMKLDISSHNSFPHSSGIASSASAMAAVAMCICDIEAQLFSLPYGDELLNKASYIARLGSGSASRSVIPEVGAWGAHGDVLDSSDLYAVGVSGIAEVFKTYHDDILIVSAAEKSVSSTAGHALMVGNVYADSRYQQANDRVGLLLDIMKSGDVHAFGKLAEDEAMTLHALMMCSNPSYVLMEPGTLDMIREIRDYRKETGDPIYFTLDAGPNIHLLYPDEYKHSAERLINDHLKQYTSDGRVIKDKVGNGPQRLS